MSSTRKSIINVIPLQVKPDDKRIYTLEKKVFNVTPSLLKPGSPRDFANFLLSKGNVSTYLWENEQQKVVGYLALSVLEDTQKLEIRSIAVAPDFQSSGIGTKMMLYAETIARQKKHTYFIASHQPQQ